MMRKMKRSTEIAHRVREHANLYIQTDLTTREIAKLTGYCHGTVSLDLRERLVEVAPELCVEVQRKAAKHISEGRVKGGKAGAQYLIARNKARRKNP